MNCRQVNHQLILGTIDAEMTSLLELLELADPSLSCLSPLARAAWRLHSQGSFHINEAELALASTFLVPCDDVEEMLGGDALCSSFFETVEHTIEVDVRTPSETRSIILKFESDGSCEYRGDGPPWFSLSELELEPSAEVLTDNDVLIAYARCNRHESPTCYPCDTDFIGIPTYTQVSIGVQHVSGPSLSDCYCNVEWIDQGLQQEPLEGGEFCWLHQLTSSQAEALGLARNHGNHADPAMPDWLADDLQFSKVWITTDDLQYSYAQGNVTSYGLGDLLLCLGAGPNWSPCDREEQVDEVDGEMDAIDRFPETQRPLKVCKLAKEPGYLCCCGSEAIDSIA